MKNFRDFLKEEVLPTVQVADGGLDISKPAVRAAMNAAIAGVVSQPAVTPYVVFNRLSKLLAQYHIVLPKRFLEGDKGVEVFELRQFGHKMGMTDSGEFVNEVPSTHYLFLQYGIITPFGITYAKPVVGGMFKVMARIVDKEELDKLIDMAEITMAEEAEVNQAIAKANAPRDPMHDITSDEKKKGNKEAVGASEKKSLDEEERPNAWGQYPKEAKQIRKQLRQEKKAKAFAKAQAKSVKEDKDPCWKGYEMIGMKKKGGRKVPNCVPTNEENIEEGQVTGPRSYKGSPDRKRKAVQMALGRKHKDHPDWNERTNPQHSALTLGRKLQKQGIKEEEQIDELSNSTLASYLYSASDSLRNLDKKEKTVKNMKKIDMRDHGMHTATNKIIKRDKKLRKALGEEQIDEVSKRLLGRYIKKAHVSGLGAAAEGEQAYSSKDKEALHRSNKTGEKREQGIERAVNKMTGSARVHAKEAYEKQEAGVKTKDGKTHTLHRRNPGHPTEYHTVTTKDAEGKTTVKAGKPKYIKKHWDKLEEKAPPGAKFERMVKHIKKGYAKDGELTKKEKGIAFATAWKAKNREKGE